MPQIDRDAEYDVVVIGAGSTGENVAGRVTKGGLTCVVVENELVGGDCSYWACMPSKALLRSGQALRAAQTVEGARQAITGDIDSRAVLRRRDAFTSHWSDDGQIKWLETNHVDLARGRGRLAGERVVTVTPPSGPAFTLTARKAVAISTGTRASIPPIPGIETAAVWTSREATSATEVPRRLLILGGGVVGCEMADAWRTLGTEEVTLVAKDSRLLVNAEDFAGEAVRASFEQRGIWVLLGTTADRVARAASGEVTAELTGGITVAGDQLLVATGRTPRSDDIGLDTVGLRPGSWLTVDDTCQVEGGGGWLYAAGDINHRALLTHMGKYQGRITADRILGRDVRLRSDRGLSPRVTFTDPQVAAVGHTLASAREAGIDARAVDVPTGGNAGGSFVGPGAPGTARIVVDEARRIIVGATFTGPEIAEALHAATIAVIGEVSLDDLWHAVPCFPTRSELWLNLLQEYGM
jgi:pyruvate/2-oxoglutarate dehydrogenase complex dihydrolipoamide dehydrogenase (E3) component